MSKRKSDLLRIKSILIEKLNDIKFKEKCLLKRIEDLETEVNNMVEEEQYLNDLLGLLEETFPVYNQTVYFKIKGLPTKETVLYLN